MAPVTLQPPPLTSTNLRQLCLRLVASQWLLLDRIPPLCLDASSTLPPPQQGRHRTPSSPTAPSTDPLLHFLLMVIRSIYDSDLTLLLCVWFFRMWVVRWPQEHARQRLRRVWEADSGGYFLTRTTSSPMTTRPSRSRLHARSLLPAPACTCLGCKWT